MSYPLSKPFFQDRPGWVPAHLTTHWDPNPYAYQTEEELMPAGGFHNRLLARLMQLLDHTLQKQNLMLLPDTFLLYRDANGIKQRVSPDLLLMPWCEEAPSVYDLDTAPPPVFVAEVISPHSHVKDLELNVPFYFGLGIQVYLVIDGITPTSQLRKFIQLHLWRMENGQIVKVAPDQAGRLTIPELGVSVSVWGRRLLFTELATGAPLLDSQELFNAYQTEAQRAEAEAQRAMAEATARQVAEAKLQATEAELAKLKAFMADKGYPLP